MRRQRTKRDKVTNWQVVRTIRSPEEWWIKQHSNRILFFYPECNNTVDPDYDFNREENSCGAGDWFNEAFPHQLVKRPFYDGVLMSKVFTEDTAKRAELIGTLGVHRYLRLPDTFPVFGDCGAFTFVKLPKPPITTDYILTYYTRLGFDYGVSIDHIIPHPSFPERRFRYDLTIANAEDFIREHRKRCLTWEPVGVVQGWDLPSYVRAAKWYVAMGYRYIAFGGITRKTTKQIVAIVDEMYKAVPQGVKVHLFGVARTAGVREFACHGVYSFDSLSYFHQALYGKFVGPDHSHTYATIRVPEIGRSHVAKQMLDRAGITEREAHRRESLALDALRAYDADRCTLDDVIIAVMQYDGLFRKLTRKLIDKYRRVLHDKPWRRCECDLCKRHGIEMVVSRGKNRTFRCGFHNTFVFYKTFERIMGK